MALIFCDGGDIDFDDNNKGIWDSVYVGGQQTLKWNDTTQKRSGSGSINFYGRYGGLYLRKNVSANATLYGHLAVYFPQTPEGYYDTAQRLFAVYNGTTQHLSVSIDNSSGFLKVRRGNWSGTVIATGTTAIIASQWYSIEWRMTIDDTNGVVIIKINGVTDIDLSNADTRNGGDAVIDIFELNLGTAKNTVDIYVDDIALDNANFPGRVAVYPLTVSSDGYYESWTLSSGTDTYALLDENPPSMTDYISSDVSNAKSSCGISHSVPSGATILGIQVNSMAQLDGAGSTQFRHFTRLASTDNSGGAKSPDVTAVGFNDMFAEKPGGGSWSYSDLSSVEIGVEIV